MSYTRTGRRRPRGLTQDAKGVEPMLLCKCAGLSRPPGSGPCVAEASPEARYSPRTAQKPFRRQNNVWPIAEPTFWPSWGANASPGEYPRRSFLGTRRRGRFEQTGMEIHAGH